MKRSIPCVSVLVLVLASANSAQVTGRVSVDSSAAQSNGTSRISSISADGRYVAFASNATNLVGGDTNAAWDIFVKDRLTGATERVSVDSAGAEGNSSSGFPSISADGRFVAFASNATNLVSGDTNAALDIFVRDRLAGTTEQVSVDSSGVQGNLASTTPAISADGRFVAFASAADNLVLLDTNGRDDVFVHDRQTGTTERVSVATGGGQTNTGSDEPAISADGRYVSFDSVASNLVVGDTNLCEDVFLRDRLLGTTERVSVATGGAQANSLSGQSSMSADGRYIAFVSFSSNLVALDTNGAGDIFVRDRQAGTTERVSVTSGGAQADSGNLFAWISSDGRCVSFRSSATNLVPGDTNGVDDIFVRDRLSGTTELVSAGLAGAPGDLASGYDAISADGRYVTFTSDASNLVNADTNADTDVFVHDRAATGFTSLCEPGVGGVIMCPCSNPPNGIGRGCDNSSSSGGALLAASGIAYLSADNLVFRTTGEPSNATSIVLQGDVLLTNGLVFGQGVRCVGGTLKRLFTKTAVGGSITAPDFNTADPTVSARSTALGGVIQAGQIRGYLVFYRDGIVLGGCPATSTFSTTQTGQVAWSL